MKLVKKAWIFPLSELVLPEKILLCLLLLTVIFIDSNLEETHIFSRIYLEEMHKYSIINLEETHKMDN